MRLNATQTPNVRVIDVNRFEQVPMEASYMQFPNETILDRHGGVITHSAKDNVSHVKDAPSYDVRFTGQVPKTRVAGCRFLLGGWRAILWFPMSIRIGIGRGCRPDLRIQAFELLAGAPVEEASQCASLDEAGFMPNLRKSLCCAGRVAGLAAFHVFLPGIVPILQKLLCVSGFVAAFMRPPKHNSESVASSDDLGLIEWNEFSLARFLKEVLEQMYTPAFICRSLKEFWSLLHPESFYLADCSVALLEVDRDQKRLSKMIAKGKIVGDTSIEKAWIKAHKKAAQRLAHLLKDLPDEPPLKKLIDFLERNSVEMGRSLEDFASPVQCLSDGSFSFVIHLDPADVKEVKGQMAQEMPCRVVNDRRNLMDVCAERGLGEQFFARRPSVNALYAANPISEISEFPLEAELEALASDEDFQEENSREGPTEIVLPLYGRQDHGIEEKDLTAVEKVELSIRGLKLLFAFLPFILMGVFLLLVAYTLDLSKKNPKQERYAILSSKRKKWVNQMRTAAFERLLQGCRDGGAAFIKWGQWSASREDLFPVEFCDVLSALHDQAPVHTMAQTRKEILRAFGRPVEEIFEAFEHEPLASGSVAQVHRAMYRKNGRVIPVIVKVRHPNVGQQIHQDFQILKPLAGMASRVPTLKNLPLKESVSQFSNTMTAQTDFRVEAAHIRRFGQNFEDVKNAVVIPQIVEELVSESVLVETYEEGLSVARFIKNPSELNTKIVTLGVDAYLKMLLTDNFVHTDLHPGNILVREVDQDNGEKGLQIVLLDFGLAEELRPKIRKHFISFLNLISKGDGDGAARHLLQWSDDQQCPNPDAFIEDMRQLFKTECNVYSVEGIDLDAVMKSVLRLARKHSVSIDSGYASLVIGVCIIVGFAHSLDPRVNLMDAATPVLLTYALTGRVVGRLYG